MNTNRFLGSLTLAMAIMLGSHIVRGDEAEELMAKGDEFDKKLQPKEALEDYLPAFKLEPNNVSLLCRIARQYRHMMSETSSKQEKLKLGYMSLDYANKAASLGSDNAEAQL